MQVGTVRVKPTVIICLLLMTLAAHPLFAVKASCDQNSCTDEIDRLYVTDKDGKPLVYVSIEDKELAKKKLNCKLVSGWYFTLEPDHPAFEQIYELLLAAKTGHDKQNHLLFRLVDNSPNCRIGYVVASWTNDRD